MEEILQVFLTLNILASIPLLFPCYLAPTFFQLFFFFTL